jgi:hypothetical protein
MWYNKPKPKLRGVALIDSVANRFNDMVDELEVGM